jgi:hypothetical protein
VKYTATIGEHHARPLLDLIFSKKGLEGAAYLLCGVSTTDTETRLCSVPRLSRHGRSRQMGVLSAMSMDQAA